MHLIKIRWLIIKSFFLLISMIDYEYFPILKHYRSKTEYFSNKDLHFKATLSLKNRIFLQTEYFSDKDLHFKATLSLKNMIFLRQRSAL